MAGKKPLTGILHAIDDALETGVFKKSVHVPKGVTITRVPKAITPESITAAAIRTPDGKIYQGTHHFMAADKIKEPYHHTELESGFLTNTGRFVSRQEATAIVSPQSVIGIPPDQIPNTVADDLNLQPQGNARQRKRDLKRYQELMVEDETSWWDPEAD